MPEQLAHKATPYNSPQLFSKYKLPLRTDLYFVRNTQNVILPFSLKLQAVDNFRLLLAEVP